MLTVGNQQFDGCSVHGRVDESAPFLVNDPIPIADTTVKFARELAIAQDVETCPRVRRQSLDLQSLHQLLDTVRDFIFCQVALETASCVCM